MTGTPRTDLGIQESLFAAWYSDVNGEAHRDAEGYVHETVQKARDAGSTRWQAGGIIKTAYGYVVATHVVSISASREERA
jgi:hypothetical protein